MPELEVPERGSGFDDVRPVAPNEAGEQAPRIGCTALKLFVPLPTAAFAIEGAA
jgi:hypothetical protein